MPLDITIPGFDDTALRVGVYARRAEDGPWKIKVVWRQAEAYGLLPLTRIDQTETVAYNGEAYARLMPSYNLDARSKLFEPGTHLRVALPAGRYDFWFTVTGVKSDHDFACAYVQVDLRDEPYALKPATLTEASRSPPYW